MSTRCYICGFTDEDPINYGEIFVARGKSGISAHYYCLLLSTDCLQRGKDSAGILGFQLVDIRRTIANAEKHRCCYCKDKGASIQCAEPNCDRIFHLICGFKKDCLNIFQNEFASYCHQHVPPACRTSHQPQETCPICREMMGPYNVATSITPECCDFGWMHLECIRRTALSAGYYLKCPFCSDPSFRSYIPKRGVFVPDRDATWELQKQAYGELLWRYDKCDAEPCRLKSNGQRQTKESEILVCVSCASAGMHQACSGLAVGGEYRCDACVKVFNSSTMVQTIAREHHDNGNDENNISIDQSMYCHKAHSRPVKRIQYVVEFSDEEQPEPSMDAELRFLLQQRLQEKKTIVPSLNENPPCIDLCSSDGDDAMDADRLIDDIGKKPIRMPAPLPEPGVAEEIRRNIERKELMRLRCEMFLKSGELYIQPPKSPKIDNI